MHHSSKRQAQQDHVQAFRNADKIENEIGPPTLYRSELFRKMKNVRVGSNVGQLGDREIADGCRLSVGTVRAALQGSAVRIDTLWKMSRYFGIPWALVWDVDKRFTWEILEDGTGIAAHITPDSASGTGGE